MSEHNGYNFDETGCDDFSKSVNPSSSSSELNFIWINT